MKKFGIFAVFAAVIAFSTAAQAQLGPVRGVVMKLEADGSKTPVAGALVEPYRADISRGSAPSAKTNARGEFNFAGFPLGNRYFLAVSGEGIAPGIYPDVRANMEGIEVLVREGDGKRYTEDEARTAHSEVQKLISGDPNAAADQKRQEEEYQRELEKFNAAKKRAEQTHQIVSAALKDGDAAFQKRDYDLAIARFDEGINADPDFEGSAPVLLNYKGVALRMRGFSAYERSVRGDPANRDAEMGRAKADLNASADAFNRGLEILTTKTNDDPKIRENMVNTRKSILTNFVETHRLLVLTKADRSRAKEAIPIYEEYFKIETDPAARLKAMVTLGDILREAGESEDAITAYRRALEADPNNFDSMAGLGLSLFNVGVIEESTEKMQEGLDIMQRFADTAPDAHPLKESVREAVDYLKTEQKLTPQRRPTPPRRRT
jgi:tetratricopeptide (TPR) repeat protein